MQLSPLLVVRSYLDSFWVRGSLSLLRAAHRVASCGSILFGAQRLALSDGLAVPIGEVDAGVSSGLGWALGDLGLFGLSTAPLSQSSDDARQLSEAGGEVGSGEAGGEVGSGSNATVLPRLAAFNALTERLGILSMALVAIMFLNLFLIWHWQTRRNRTFYSEKKQRQLRASFRLLTDTEQADKIQQTFHRFPGVCVFPGPLLVVCKLFITGLVANSVDLVIAADECRGRCRAVGIACLVFEIGFIFLGWYVVIDWNVRFRRMTWRPATMPASTEDVKDPLFRLLSNIRLRVCRGRQNGLVKRVRGKVARPAECTDEPQRTERLLRRWYRLRHDNAADTMDAFQFVFFVRGSGLSWADTIFDHYGLTTQVLIAALAGLSRHIEVGSSHATLQVLAVVTLQFLHGLYCLGWLPSNDKAEAYVQGAQFTLEGVRSTLLLVQGAAPAASVQQASLGLSLVAVVVPIVRYFYDAVVVQLITLHRGGKLNRIAVLVAVVGLLANIQLLVMKVLGFGDMSMSKDAANKAQTASKLTARASEQEITVEVAIALSSVCNDAYQLAQSPAGIWPSEERVDASIRVQRVQRGRSVRSLLRRLGIRTGVRVRRPIPLAGFSWLTAQVDAIMADDAHEPQASASTCSGEPDDQFPQRMSRVRKLKI